MMGGRLQAPRNSRARALQGAPLLHPLLLLLQPLLLLLLLLLLQPLLLLLAASLPVVLDFYASLAARVHPTGS